MAIDLDLFASVVEALDTALLELQALADNGPEVEWPVPDDLQLLLDQREALLATLARVCQGFEGRGRKATAGRVRAIYAEELPKANGEYRMPAAPVNPEAVVMVEGVREEVRRAALVDGSTRDALDAVRT